MNDNFIFVRELRKINSSKLTSENRVYIHPICDHGNRLFSLSKDWKLIGWGNPPWDGGTPNRKHAIVYEKLSESNDKIGLDTYASFEPGIYWGHGNADTMKFLINK